MEKSIVQKLSHDKKRDLNEREVKRKFQPSEIQERSCNNTLYVTLKN